MKTKLIPPLDVSRVLIASFLLPLFGCADLCGNELLHSVRSPNGKFTAVVFVRDCGATTVFSTQVSIVSADRALLGEAGNTFVGDGRLSISVKWDIDGALYISGVGEGSRIVKQEPLVSGVRVSYAPL